MGDVMQDLGFGGVVRATDRTLTRPGKAMVRVQQRYLELPPEQRTRDVWMAMCRSNNVNEAQAQKLADFASAMFPNVQPVAEVKRGR